MLSAFPARLRRPALAVLGGAALVLLAAPAALADPPPRVLSVSGTGETSAVPDRAELSAGVVTEARSVAAALASNNEKMNAVLASLKKLGIPERAIQTSNFSVSPQYAPYDAKVPGGQRILGYQVSNTVTVKVDDQARIGPALDALAAAGANQLGGISFSFKDPKPLLADARAEAVKDARAKAEAYAGAAGVSLGPILSISEGGVALPQPMYMDKRAVMAEATPVAAGESSVSASVTIVWEIR